MSDRRSSDDADAVVRSCKSIRPDLRARIEQRNRHAGFRVTCVNFFALMAVADRARKPEIGLVVGTTLRQRDDMLASRRAMTRCYGLIH
jgi:hypothetical protein